MRKRGWISTKTIEKATKFLQEVSGKSLFCHEIEELRIKVGARSGLHIFAAQLGYAQKVDKKWLFRKEDYQPIHGRKLCERANEYQYELRISRADISKNKSKEDNVGELNIVEKTKDEADIKNEILTNISNFFDGVKSNKYGGNENYTERENLLEAENIALNELVGHLFEVFELRTRIDSLKHLRKNLENN